MSYSSTIWCEEMLGSPQESGSNDKGGSFQATVNLKCAWSKRYDLLADIIGNQNLYPRLKKSGARAVSGTAKPHPGAVRNMTNPTDYGGADYDFAQVDITYKVQAETKDLISETLTPTLEIMTLDYRRFRWATDTSSAVIPDGRYQLMKSALTQGFGKINWGRSVDEVFNDTVTIIMNACKTKPCTIAINTSGGCYAASGTGHGPYFKDSVAAVQPLMNAVSAARDLAIKPPPRNAKEAKAAPTSMDQFTNMLKTSPIVNARGVNVAGPPNANTPVNVQGKAADIQKAVNNFLGGMTPRFQKLGTPINENEAPGRRMLGLDYGLTFYKVKDLPWWLTCYLGCVNDDVVIAKLLGLSFAPGTLLFDTPNVSRKWNFVDDPYWQVEYKLKFKPQGWNVFPRSDINSWIQDSKGNKYLSCGAFDSMIVNSGTDAAPRWGPFFQYPPADFGQIWGMSGGGSGTFSTAWPTGGP